jgi:diguanylate cyclase (GGDEF)-like protein
MNLDVNTLFMVAIYVEALLGLLLLFVWVQNTQIRAVAWWGCAHLMRSGSIVLFGMYGTVSDLISIDLANAILFLSFGITWTGARVFDNRPPLPAYLLLGPLVWFFASHVPGFTVNIDLRVLFSCGIIASYTWATAYEFWRGRAEPLVSRWPAIFMLFAHGALFLLRTPLAGMLPWLPAGPVEESAWLIVMTFEALLFTISIAFILLAMAKERNEYRHKTAARIDPLTGIANRRGFLEQTTASRRLATGGLPTAVLLFDLDNFKSINDQYGHPVGDRTLEIFAATATTHVGEAGLVGRWGGDEFVAVLYDTSRDVAITVAERVQLAFEKAAADIGGRLIGATVSTGIAFSTHGPFELPALLLQADQALYRAKKDGRNRIAIFSPDPLPVGERAAESGNNVIRLGRRSAA